MGDIVNLTSLDRGIVSFGKYFGSLFFIGWIFLLFGPGAINRKEADYVQKDTIQTQNIRDNAYLMNQLDKRLEEILKILFIQVQRYRRKL